MREEKPTSATPGDRSKTPVISYGNWGPTEYLRWEVIKDTPVPGQRVLMQKFRRRVKRDFGHGTISRSYEYEWFPVPEGP